MANKTDSLFECSSSMKQIYRNKMLDYLLTGNPKALYDVSVHLKAHKKLETKLKSDLGDKYTPLMKMFQLHLPIYENINLITKDIKSIKDEKKIKALISERNNLVLKAPLINYPIITIFQKLVSYTDLVNIPIQAPSVKSTTSNKMPVEFITTSTSSEKEEY